MQLQQVARCPLPVASCKLVEWNRYILELQTVVGCRLLLLLLLLLSLVGWQSGTLTLQSESKQKSTGPVQDWLRESESPIKCISRWVYWISDQTKWTAKAFDFSASISVSRFGYAFDFGFVCTPSHCSPTDSRDHLGVRDRETDWETALAANTNATPAAVEGCSKL